MLALHDGEVVSTDRLVEVVWADGPPPAALNTLQSHVSHLRGVLGSKAAIVARPPGYVLDLGADGTDVQVAERLLRQGTQAADPVQGARRPAGGAGAVARAGRWPTWPALAWLEEQAGRLDLLRLQVRRALSEARLAAGEHAQLVPDLEQLAAEHPLDEQLHAQLMLALYRCGRQADALAAYHRLRRTLGRGAGHRPQPDAARPGDRHPAPGPGARPRRPGGRAACGRAGGRRCPRSCRSAVPGVRRARRRAGPPRRAAAADGRRRTSAPTPRWSSRPCPAPPGSARPRWPCTGRTGWPRRFPDGQLYVNLRGFDPAGQALEPGAGAARVPGRARRAGGPDPGRTCRPRPGCTAACSPGRRVLVVLDNARDAEQVRPLLPGLARLPGPRDQPQPAHRPGRRRGRPPADPGPAHRRRGPRPARPPPGRRPGRPRAGRGRRDHRPLRAAAAGAGHRRRPRRHQPGLPARRPRRRAARDHPHAGRLRRR